MSWAVRVGRRRRSDQPALIPAIVFVKVLFDGVRIFDLDLEEETMFTGTGTALVTPFRRDGSLDESTLRALVKRQINAGINFLVPCGTTGESPTLTHQEHLRVVEIVVELAKGKVPVLAGAGG